MLGPLICYDLPLGPRVTLNPVEVHHDRRMEQHPVGFPRTGPPRSFYYNSGWASAARSIDSWGGVVRRRCAATTGTRALRSFRSNCTRKSWPTPPLSPTSLHFGFSLVGLPRTTRWPVIGAIGGYPEAGRPSPAREIWNTTQPRRARIDDQGAIKLIFRCLYITKS